MTMTMFAAALPGAFAGVLPGAARQMDQTDYAPGIVAFLVIFVIALVCWFLFRSMTKHIRRANANAKALEAAAPEGKDAG